MQPVIVKGTEKFFITEIGIDQTDWETGILEQSQLSKPGHSSIIYEDVFLTLSSLAFNYIPHTRDNQFTGAVVLKSNYQSVQFAILDWMSDLALALVNT